MFFQIFWSFPAVLISCDVFLVNSLMSSLRCLAGLSISHVIIPSFNKSFVNLITGVSELIFLNYNYIHSSLNNYLFLNVHILKPWFIFSCKSCSLFAASFAFSFLNRFFNWFLKLFDFMILIISFSWSCFANEKEWHRTSAKIPQ